MVPLPDSGEMSQGRRSVDNDGAGSIRLLWMIVPDIDLVTVRWGNVVWVLAPYEYAGIDRLTRIEFQVEFKVIPG